MAEREILVTLSALKALLISFTVCVIASVRNHTTTIECKQSSLDNGRSPHVYINQRLQIQFGAPDDERCAARNMFSLQ